MGNVRRLGFAVVGMIGLAGCALPASPGRMTVTALPAANFPPPLHASMCVEQVAGGEATYLMGMSEVGNAQFQQALSQSLAANGLLASGHGCRFPVTADIVELNQPLIGIDMKVSARLAYTLRQDGLEKPLMHREISSYYIASFGSSLLAVERLRIANEGAVRANITKFLRKLETLVLPQMSKAQSEAPVSRTSAKARGAAIM